MDTPQFVDGQFVNGTMMNSAMALLMADFALTSALHYPGLLNPTDMTVTAAGGMTVDIDMPSPFAVLFGNGLVVGAHGTADGADTQTYSIDLTALVPATGSQTVYVVAKQSAVGENQVTVVGPPNGHPDYDPTSNPFEFYTTQRDSLTIVATTTAPDNTTTFELFRTTLSAGQATITQGNIVTLHWTYAGSVLAPTGVAPGSYSNATVTVNSEGRITNISSAVSYIAGEMKLWPNVTPPAGWLACNGATVSRTQYPNLFNLIGTTFGNGDGSGTTFSLPDMRGRVPVGFDSGQAAGRVTAAGSGVNAGVVGAVGGSQALQSHNHTLHDPGHTHNMYDPGHAHGVSDPGHAHGVYDPGHYHLSWGEEGWPFGLTGSGAMGSGSSDFNQGYGNTSSVYTGIGIDAALTGISIAAAGTNISIDGAGTGMWIDAAGGGGSQNVQPSLVLNYIIYAS